MRGAAVRGIGRPSLLKRYPVVNDLCNMRYFQKELVDTPLFLPTGGRLAFQDAGDDVGILATDNPRLLAELDKVIFQHRGGVSEIDAAAYEGLKKKSMTSGPSLIASPLRARQSLSRVLQGPKRGIPAAEAAKAQAVAKAKAGVPVKSAPLEVPNLMPIVGQMWRPKEAK